LHYSSQSIQLSIGSFCAISSLFNSAQPIIFGAGMSKNTVEISYCTQCRWLLRAAWLAQELLTTFEANLSAVSLLPDTGGVFEVRLNGAVIFNRKDAGRFPESKELKQLIRDVIDPARDLGHSER
jgi:selenoprotein W-related protein